MATVRQDPSGLFLFRPGEEIMEGIERGQEKKKRNRLAQLAQQAVTAGAPQQEQLVAEAVGVDPEAGFALGQQTRTMEEARNQRLGRLAMILTGVPEPQRPQLYQQMLPELTRLGLQAPPQYTPEVDQTAMRLAAVLGGGEEGAGRRIQSTFINESGELVGVINDPAAPNGIRLVNTGEYADPRMRFFQPESGPPALVAQRGRQAGRATEVTLGGGAPPAADPDQLGALFARYESMVEAGIPEEQARGWLQQQLNQAGATLSPGFDIPGAPVEPPSPVSIGVAPSGRNPLAKMSPAERAAAEAEAKAGVELRTAPLIAGATETAKLGAKEGADETKRARAFRTYEQGIRNMIQGLSGTVTGPIAGRLPALTEAQQIGEGAVAQLAPLLKSIFRDAGEGTFTDNDQILLMDMIPTRVDLPGARAAKLQFIDRIVREKLGAPPEEGMNLPQAPEDPTGIQRRIEQAGESLSGAAQTAQRTVGLEGPSRPTTEADYDALPSGALFIDPDDGRTYRKP